MFKKLSILTLIASFSLTSLGPLPQAHADAISGLPAPGTMVNLSPPYQPVIIRGLTVHKDNPFLFDFIVDVGQDRMSGESLKKEGEKLIKYFLASLAIPDKDFWVNLSPYEKNKIIPEALSQTDMGRDLLEQDYILKQITASLIYPEKQLGKTFWDKVYAKARSLYGTTQVPVNTFNKVWIMADKAEVFEHNQTVFVVKQHLKVMLEEDYLALQKYNSSVIASEAKQSFSTKGGIHTLGSQIVREIILPELEKEVNTGKNFANLRQIFNSIILSSWYKNNLKQALLNQVYADKSKVKGIGLNDPTIKQQIYEQYLKAYKKGVFNYIKEDVNEANGQMVPKKYFSGGILRTGVASHPTEADQAELVQVQAGWNDPLVDFATLAAANEGAMAAVVPDVRIVPRGVMVGKVMVGKKVFNRQSFETVITSMYETVSKQTIILLDSERHPAKDRIALAIADVKKLRKNKGEVLHAVLRQFGLFLEPKPFNGLWVARFPDRLNTPEALESKAEELTAWLQRQELKPEFGKASSAMVAKTIYVTDQVWKDAINEALPVEDKDMPSVLKTARRLLLEVRSFKDFLRIMYKTRVDMLEGETRAEVEEYFKNYFIKKNYVRKISHIRKFMSDSLNYPHSPETLPPGLFKKMSALLDNGSLTNMEILEIFLTRRLNDFEALYEHEDPAMGTIFQYTLVTAVSAGTIFGIRKYAQWVADERRLKAFLQETESPAAGPYARMLEIEKSVKGIIANIVESYKGGKVAPERVGPNVLLDNLFHDSLAKVELTMALEHEFDIEHISDENMDKMKTVRDVIIYIAQAKGLDQEMVSAHLFSLQSKPEMAAQLAGMREPFSIISLHAQLMALGNRGEALELVTQNLLGIMPALQNNGASVLSLMSASQLRFFIQQMQRNNGAKKFNGILPEARTQLSSKSNEAMISRNNKLKVSFGRLMRASFDLNVLSKNSSQLRAIFRQRTKDRLEKFLNALRNNYAPSPARDSIEALIKDVAPRDFVKIDRNSVLSLIDQLVPSAGEAMDGDKATIAGLTQTWKRGGIDLNTSNGMQWTDNKDGQGVQMNIDPAMVARVRNEGINSLSPVIYKITPISSIGPLIGLPLLIQD